MADFWPKWRAVLSAPQDAAALCVFRAAYGLMVSISAFRFWYYGWIDEYFLRPKFFFRYWGTAWIMPEYPPAWSVKLAFFLLFVSGLMVALGLLTRWALLLLVSAFVYVQLLDLTNYLNHYVLVTLLGLLLLLTPAGKAYSLDAKWRTGTWRGVTADKRPAFAAWCTYLLRFQVGVVYFFAGLAKAQSDWLIHAQPLNIWLTSRQNLPWIGPLLGWEHSALLFSWGGFLFDSTIVAWLLWRRTRLLAYLAVLGFHAMTSALFPIGMFPVIMSVSALVFFAPSWPRRLLSRQLRTGPLQRLGAQLPACGGLLSALLALQLLWPLRCHLYGGNVLWHEQGMRFSWRVMLREKNASVSYLVEDRQSKKRTLVYPRDFLDARQEREFSTQPDMIWQLAQAIAKREAARGRDVAVRVDAIASLNGRAPARLIDPEVDLSRVRDDFSAKSWILPAPTAPPPRLRAIK